MLRMRKRIERLEMSFVRYRVPDLREELRRRSFQELSVDDLQTMRDFLKDKEEGICRPLTERQSAVFAAYNVALELACQRAGFKSLEEFNPLPTRRVEERTNEEPVPPTRIEPASGARTGLQVPGAF